MTSFAVAFAVWFASTSAMFVALTQNRMGSPARAENAGSEEIRISILAPAMYTPTAAVRVSLALPVCATRVAFPSWM